MGIVYHNLNIKTCTDEELLVIAFPFVTGYNTERIVENHRVYKISEEGKVYAALKRDSMVVDEQKPVARLLQAYIRISKDKLEG